MEIYAVEEKALEGCTDLASRESCFQFNPPNFSLQTLCTGFQRLKKDGCEKHQEGG
jgi:hypothetical protein